MPGDWDFQQVSEPVVVRLAQTVNDSYIGSQFFPEKCCSSFCLETVLILADLTVQQYLDPFVKITHVYSFHNISIRRYFILKTDLDQILSNLPVLLARRHQNSHATYPYKLRKVLFLWLSASFVRLLNERFSVRLMQHHCSDQMLTLYLGQMAVLQEAGRTQD